MVKLLYPYSRNKIRNMVSTPKLHMLDTGLAAFLTGWTSPEVLMNGAMAGVFLVRNSNWYIPTRKEGISTN